MYAFAHHKHYHFYSSCNENQYALAFLSQTPQSVSEMNQEDIESINEETVISNDDEGEGEWIGL